MRHMTTRALPAGWTALLLTILIIDATAALAQAPTPTQPPTLALRPSSSESGGATTQAAATERQWNWHAQNTDIFQGDGDVPEKYSGPNSLSPKSQIQHTVTADLIGGDRIGQGTELHADFQMWQGYGLSQTLGVEAFPNSDAYKLGVEAPNFTFARLCIRKTIGLGGEQEDESDDQLDIPGKEDIKRLTLTIGRFSMLDVFDYNTYANDPHTQFMNWGGVGNLTFDYAADSIGYTTGVSAEFNQPKWALRYGFFQLPSVPNSFTEDDQLLMWPHRGADGPFWKSWTMASELERRYNVKQHPGHLRLLAWADEADMATYTAETAILKADGPGASITPARVYRYKYGFGLNWEQEMSDNLGLFSRLGWNDGREEAWAYTDANWSASLGACIKGGGWHRPDDTVGIMDIVSGASTENQQFLEAGGLGILDGDGALRYGWENSTETYYNRRICTTAQVALDYQCVSNPSFNEDRGPVSVFGVRFHWER